MLATIGTVIVLILKIIGIILLGLLGLIVLLICLVLFVPFRYKAEGTFDEQIYIHVKFSWLLHLLNGSLVQRDKVSDFRFRIAFFTIVPKKKRKKQQESKQNLTSNVKPMSETTSESMPKPAQKQISKSKSTIKTKPEIKTKSTSSPASKPKTKKKATSKEKNISGFDKVKVFWRFLQAEENQGLLKHILRYLGRLLKWVFPKKAYARMELGLEDPATTGYISGLTSIIYVKTRGNFQVTPNFHEAVIRGTFKIKGRLYLYQAVYYIIRIIIDKRVRRLLKYLRTM